MWIAGSSMHVLPLTNFHRETYSDLIKLYSRKSFSLQSSPAIRDCFFFRFHYRNFLFTRLFSTLVEVWHSLSGVGSVVQSLEGRFRGQEVPRCMR